jgi:hypothetical protein
MKSRIGEKRHSPERSKLKQKITQISVGILLLGGDEIKPSGANSVTQRDHIRHTNITQYK